MFLDTVKPDLPDTDLLVVKVAALPYADWLHFPHSCISHHGTACCEMAREWLLNMDFSQLAGESVLTGPRWIRARYDWGPSAHPIHWCEVVRRKTLDCGALAALANECFTARDVRSFPAQFIQRYSTDATDHWADKWQQDDVSTHWIKDDVIYHEGCAVLTENGALKLWDASAAWWINPLQAAGYGSLAALRIIAPKLAADAAFQWGAHSVGLNKWIIV